MNYIKPEDIKEYVGKNPTGIAGHSEELSAMVNHFSELIVRECSKVIRHGGQRKGAFGNEDLRPSEIATMIEEHFGVEE